MIQDSSPHSTVEPSTRQIIMRRSKLIPQHRSIVPTINRSTITRKNQSAVVQTIGRMTTTIPPCGAHCYTHQRYGAYRGDDEEYEEERAIEYKAILAVEDRLLHLSSWTKNVTSIDRTIPTPIDTHHHQKNRKRASTDIAYYQSIDAVVDRCWGRKRLRRS